MPTGSKLRVSKGAEPGVQFPPFPLSKRNRTECPSATEIRNVRATLHVVQHGIGVQVLAMLCCQAVR